MRINDITTKSQRKEVKDFIMTQCSDSLKVPPIWRGTSITEPYRYLDSTSLPLRKSANTNNYVHLIISNMKSWQGFPRRQVICTTDRMYALGYGNVYRVFPVNGTPIGVCHSSDFWIFPYLKEKTKMYINDLDNHIESLGRKVLKRAPNNHDINALGDDLEQMKSHSVAIQNIIDLLDPHKNDMQVHPIKSLPGVLEFSPKREVWFDGKAVMVAEKETWILGFKEFLGK